MNQGFSRRVTNVVGAPMLIGGALVGSAALIAPEVPSADPVATTMWPDSAVPGGNRQARISFTTVSASASEASHPMIPIGLWGATPNANLLTSQ